VTVTTAINTGTSSVIETNETIYQAMGQNPIETRLQSDPVHTRYVDTTYDGLNRVSTASNPYWTSSDTTYGLTSYTYDALNRTLSVTHPDNTAQTFTYTNNSVLFTDEDGNQWQRTSDALGRLTQVLEPNGTSTTPTMETDYTYDALGNLRSVEQWGGPNGTSGARSRSFIYDGLSHLVSSTN
jgi:YD repeat-containing protein